MGHLGERGTCYNCNDERDFAAVTGLRKLGVHNMPALVGRGVRVDMAKYYKLDSMQAGQYFNEKQIQEAAQQQGVEIREGDVVFFHTGWSDAKLASDPKAWVSG